MTKRKVKFFLGIFIIALSITVTIGNWELHTLNQEVSQVFPKVSAFNERSAYAIVVGIEDYPDPYSDLDYCIDDANSIYSKLYNNYGFDDSPIGEPYMQVLLDSDATKADIENAFSYVAHFINSYDVFFFYFSGHGHPSSIPDLCYLCPYDASAERIYGVDLDTYLDSVNCAEQYIIIDACGSGGMIDMAQAPNRYFMTACERNEECWETSALQHGVFTYYFLRSFTQAPDSNGDGVISMEDQFLYTYPQTVSYSTNLGEAHHPQAYDGITGEAVIDTTIGSLIFTPNGTWLNYSFFLYGHGSIDYLNITVCCTAENITIETFDLTSEAPSSTGFGFYSGMIEVSCGYNITSYKIRIKIYWPNNPPGSPIYIQHIFGDADEDGLTDFFEIDLGLDPRLNDTDTDGLNDYDEFYGITDPLNNDTDTDGLLDGEEVYIYFTNPLVNDTDTDGLLDGEEAYTYFTDALVNDTDTDGLLDGEEVYTYFTDPLVNDTDTDGLLDGEEVNQFFTEPDDPDTDDDGMPDGFEVYFGLDPFNNDAQQDLDSDQMDNFDEYLAGSDPDDSDTDNDGMEDGYEYNNDLNLFANDSGLDPDEDELSNLLEFQYHTNPNINDTDGDGWLDGEEVLTYNTDPLDPDDYPTFPDSNILGYEPILILCVMSLFILLLSKKIIKLYKK